MPPPRGGVILEERLLGLLKEWDIENRVFTITLDNVSYNDTLVSHLKRHHSLDLVYLLVVSSFTCVVVHIY